MIVARASTEMPGQGIIGAVATQVQEMVPGSDSEAVDYPATLTDYLNSEASGVSAMTKLIQDYAVRCPESKMALMGYSQGAQVVGDIMCGTSEANFNSTPPLSAQYSKNSTSLSPLPPPPFSLITHPALTTQHHSRGNRPDGRPDPRPRPAAGRRQQHPRRRLPRLNTAACAGMAPITKSFCNDDDRFCDSGTSIPVHLAYVQGFGTQARDFVVARVTGNVAAKGNVTKRGW
ncbi:acetylxylan esterase [Diplocarpon rosae]|nr:acetylxylan esterase [Diplocarpon rosae]